MAFCEQELNIRPEIAYHGMQYVHALLMIVKKANQPDSKKRVKQIIYELRQKLQRDEHHK